MNAPDPFALGGRQDVETMRQRQYALLDEFSVLVKAIAAIEPPKASTPPARREPEPVTEAERDALRQECEAIGAEYRAPLPEGDAGLVAAVQRLIGLRPRCWLSGRGFRVTIETEKEIINPISDAAEYELKDWIEETPAVGLAGVAAKLRYAVEELELHEFGAEQMLEIIEREVEAHAAA